MNELNFIKYLIKLSNKYDSNFHKYFPDQELKNNYDKNLCKNFNLDSNTIINIQINLNKKKEEIIDDILNTIKKIKSINKKFIVCPCRINIKNICHAVLVVYYKNKNKFYICDSASKHGNNQETINKLNEIYKIVFDDNYEIICYSLQDLEKNNKYIGYKNEEYSKGYCLAWSYLLGFILIKYNWIDIDKLIECIKWNIEYSPKIARQLIRGFIIFNI